MVSEKTNKDKKNNERCEIIKLGCNVIFKYPWNTSKHKLTKVLWNIWSAIWAFLVSPYPMRVMCLLDLVEFWLDNTHETKVQGFTKKYSVTI